MLSFLSGPVGAAYHVVTALSAGLAPLLGALAPAVAIVAFTIAVRLVLLPFSYRVMRGQAAQARLAPQIQELYKRYAGQPDKLRGEIAALREREGTGTFTGCLPAMLQWPFLSVLYLVFRSPVIGGTHNALLAHTLLGVELGSYVLGGAGLLSVHGAVFLGLFALLAAVAWLSARATRRLTAPSQAQPGNVAGPGHRGSGAGPGRPGSGAGPGQPGNLGQVRGLGQMRPHGDTVQPAGQPGSTPAWLTRLLPFTTLAVAPFLPLAADLYLLTTTVWTLLERTCLCRTSSRRTPPRRIPRPAPPVLTRTGRTGA